MLQKIAEVGGRHPNTPGMSMPQRTGDKFESLDCERPRSVNGKLSVMTLTTPTALRAGVRSETFLGQAEGWRPAERILKFLIL